MNDILQFALWNDATRSDPSLPHFEVWDEEKDGLEDWDYFDYCDDVEEW